MVTALSKIERGQKVKHLSALTLLALISLMVGCTPAATPPPTAVPPPPTEMPTATAPPPTEETSSWKLILSVEVDHLFNAVAFLDETFGLTVGGGENAVYYTTDGGQTWTKPTDVGDTACHFGLDILDAQVVWSCGGKLPAILSVDGGRTWTAASRPISPYCKRQCRFVSFLDDTTGWAASSFALAATDDGGQTWTDLALPEGVGDDLPVMAISLRTASDGYLMDATGVLHVTQDGGQSWSSQPLLDTDSMTLHSTAVRFPDADHGLVVMALVGGGQSEVLAMRTSDGGRTWEQEIVPVGPGALYLTHDGTVLTVASLFGEQVDVLRYQE